MKNKKNNLKMSLLEIRNSIDVNKTDWVNYDTTNCYAFALGLDIPEKNIVPHAYQPGVISRSANPISDYKYFSYDILINNVYNDLDALNIIYNKIDPLDRISEDEWKIAILISKKTKKDLFNDFHFMRLINNGYWYHKNGYKGSINKLDYYDQFIKDPEECFLPNYDYKCCMSLKLKK